MCYSLVALKYWTLKIQPMLFYSTPLLLHDEKPMANDRSSAELLDRLTERGAYDVRIKQALLRKCPPWIPQRASCFLVHQNLPW